MQIKIPVPESLLNKIAGLQPATLSQKRLQHMYFPAIFANFENIFIKNHFWQLLLESFTKNKKNFVKLKE